MTDWNARYRKKHYVYGTEPNAFLARMQKKLPITGNALAIAEGEGRNAVFLAEQGMNVTVWDYAETGLIKANKLAKSRGVDITTDLVDLNWAKWKTNYWDEIVCIYGHFPKKLRHQTLRAIKNAVKPGGYYITEVFSMYQIPYNSGGPKNVDLLYNPNEFLDFFSDWHIYHFFMGEVDRNEGHLHRGLAHVIQFAAKKPIL